MAVPKEKLHEDRALVELTVCQSEIQWNLNVVQPSTESMEEFNAFSVRREVEGSRSPFINGCQEKLIQAQGALRAVRLGFFGSRELAARSIDAKPLNAKPLTSTFLLPQYLHAESKELWTPKHARRAFLSFHCTLACNGSTPASSGPLDTTGLLWLKYVPYRRMSRPSSSLQCKSPP